MNGREKGVINRLREERRGGKYVRGKVKRKQDRVTNKRKEEGEAEGKTERGRLMIYGRSRKVELGRGKGKRTKR